MNVLAPARMSRRGLLGFIVTTGVTAALLLLLFVRLLAASHSTNADAGSPLVGHTASNFTISLWNGQHSQKLSLAALKGHPVVLNFWASWCDGCTEEAPILQAAAKQYAAQGVAFVGIAYEDNQQDGASWLQAHNITYASGPDSDGSIAIAYGVTGLPETVFIDRTGKINFKFGGQLDDGTLNKHIQALLK